MAKGPITNRRTPTGQDTKIVNEPKPEDLAPTLTENQEEVLYDTSQPVFMVSRKHAGRIKIPLYEEVPKVQGYFRNLENPGQSLCIPHRSWKGPIRYFYLEENRLLTIPVTLSDLLNNGACYTQKKWVTENGQIVTRPILAPQGGLLHKDGSKEICKKIPRYSFQIVHGESWKPTIVQGK